MDFNSRFNFDFKKTVITVGIILLCLVVGIFVYINSRSIEEPVVEPLPNRDLVVDNTPIDTEIEVVEQKKTVGKLIATVKNIRDLSTRIEYDIEVGLGENKTPSIVKATGVTVFYDFYKDKMINPGDIKVGDIIVIYATGKYTVGNLEAEVIAIGDDTSYNYGKLTAINSGNDGSYIWTLDGGMDKLVISKDTTAINGFTGMPLENKGLLQLKDKVLFKGSMEQTDLGNIYTCSEVITFGKG